MKRLSVTASVVVCFCVAALFARSETQTRTIYVSAVDKQGARVVDLRAADVVVTEEGQAQGPIKVERATTPMRIAVVVDDRGLGVPEVRAALSTFVEALRGHADVGVFSAVRPEATVVDFTADTQRLLEGIQRLVPMQASGQALSTMLLVLAQEFGKQGTARPVMVVVTIDQNCMDMGASRGGPAVLDSGQTSRFAVGPGRVSLTGCFNSPLIAPTLGPGVPWQQAVDEIQRVRVTFFGIASRHAAPGDHSPVIDGSAEVSGGRVDPVLTDSGITTAMQRIADDLLGQYAVTYNAAATSKDGARLKVTTKRSGITIRAPERTGLH